MELPPEEEINTFTIPPAVPPLVVEKEETREPGVVPPAVKVPVVKVPVMKKLPIKMPPGMVKIPKMPGVVRVKIPKALHQAAVPPEQPPSDK